MRIIILLILSLIFIIPTVAQEKSEVTTYVSPERLQEILGTLAEGVECQIANDSLKADLSIYDSFNSIFNAASPDTYPDNGGHLLSKIETKLALNEELFRSFIFGVIRILERTQLKSEEEIVRFLAAARVASSAKVDVRKSDYYNAGKLESHYSETLTYVARCRRWEKGIMGKYAPN